MKKTLIILVAGLLYSRLLLAQETLQSVTTAGNTFNRELISTNGGVARRLTVYSDSYGYGALGQESGITYLSATTFDRVSLGHMNNQGIYSEKICALPNGNVGIGISAPLSKLDVNGSANFSGAIHSKLSTLEGGTLFLENPSKTGDNANSWAIYNMTGPYGDGLNFWKYPANGGVNSGPQLQLFDNGTSRFSGKLDVNGSGNFSGPLTQNSYQVWHHGTLQRPVGMPVDHIGADANITADQLPTNSTTFAYTNGMYNSGAPFEGPLASFGGLNGKYDLQINAPYGQGNGLAFRTQNGDGAGQWNAWNYVYHSGNFNPSSKLDFVYNGSLDGSRSLEQSAAGKIYNATNYPVPYGMFMDIGAGIYKMQFNAAHTRNGNIYVKVSGDGGEGDWQTLYHSGNLNLSNYFPTAGGSITGNVTIGAMNAERDLAVNGNIKTRKLKVTQTDWPDYVFDSSYQLKSLHQVEKFIVANKHLPDVPSAATVTKEGVDLGDNQVVLLKKIEELTLYIIQQNKELQEQKVKVEALVKEVKELKTQK